MDEMAKPGRCATLMEETIAILLEGGWLGDDDAIESARPALLVKLRALAALADNPVTAKP